MKGRKELIMCQLHKKFSGDQIKILFKSYEAGHISRREIEQTLGIGKTRFFALLKAIRKEAETISIEYHRQSKGRLSVETEAKIRTELQRDKALVENKELPISGYNYAAINDRLKKAGVRVSTTTIVQRKKKDRPDREVITSAAGDLIQHDASIHQWSPYALNKWTLITSLDDYTRMLRYADFVESETSWAQAQYRMQHFGVPHRYYVDNLRVFRFLQNRDSLWKNMVLGTDEVNTQWRQVLALMHTDVIYARSPQAKGKIERPYRWLQDRIVRACALEHITTLAEARSILREEVHRYNYQQVHSTTREIPALRFEKAQNENRSLFRPFSLPKPFTSIKDVFCIHHQRIADGYRKISIGGYSLQIPGIEPREDVDVHLLIVS
jgi:transposase